MARNPSRNTVAVRPAVFAAEAVAAVDAAATAAPSAVLFLFAVFGTLLGGIGTGAGSCAASVAVGSVVPFVANGNSIVFLLHLGHGRNGLRGVRQQPTARIDRGRCAGCRAGG